MGLGKEEKGGRRYLLEIAIPMPNTHAHIGGTTMIPWLGSYDANHDDDDDDGDDDFLTRDVLPVGVGNPSPFTARTTRVMRLLRVLVYVCVCARAMLG